MNKYILIALGGACGSVARYWMGATLAHKLGNRFPYGTLIVNITACLIIGFSLGVLGKRADLGDGWRYLIPIGFVGAYSTFSTFEWETYVHLHGGQYIVAGVYVVSSLVLGLAATWGGLALSRVV